MEQTRPEWPGAFARDIKFPMDDNVRQVFEASLASREPLPYDETSPYQAPADISEQFNIQSQMVLAIFPKTDRPWLIGIHHCSEARIYSEAEQHLFSAIGRRVGDYLSTLIALRKLKEHEASLERMVEERTEALERSNRELEQYAYVASHDLQEPLRMVASYAELLGRRYEGELDARADKMIGYLVDGAKRMQELINDLLALSRVGTRGKPPRPTDCNETMKHVLKILRRSIKEADAEVTCGDLPWVMADPLQLQQVFQNLLSNALKFRGEASPKIQVSARQDGDWWTLSVSDNGIGVAPRFQERIFTIFQRLHEQGMYEGSGIGLALVKKIVERHEGEVSVTSDEGQGSTFTFTMPAADRA